MVDPGTKGGHVSRRAFVAGTLAVTAAACSTSPTTGRGGQGHDHLRPRRVVHSTAPAPTGPAGSWPTGPAPAPRWRSPSTSAATGRWSASCCPASPPTRWSPPCSSSALARRPPGRGGPPPTAAATSWPTTPTPTRRSTRCRRRAWRRRSPGAGTPSSASVGRPGASSARRARATGSTRPAPPRSRRPETPATPPWWASTSTRATTPTPAGTSWSSGPIAAAGPGSIISLHFGHQGTIDALPEILTTLRGRGLETGPTATLLRA